MPTTFPAWAEELRAKYLRGEASLFVLHGNVYDQLHFEGELISLPDFLEKKLLPPTKDTLLAYNPATGVRFVKKPTVLQNIDELITAKGAADVLPALEKVLGALNKVALIFEYAETVAPATDWTMASEHDRAAVVTLHRWSLSPSLQAQDNIILLVTEVLTDLSPKLLANPKVGIIKVPFPDQGERRAVIKKLDPKINEADLATMAEHTAGLKLVQIESILRPSAPSVSDYNARVDYIMRLLRGEQATRKERAERFAAMTQGMDEAAIKALIAPEGEPEPAPQAEPNPYAQVHSLILKRKREIIEKECFGLVEIVEKGFGFEAVGGMEEIKGILRTIAHNMRTGNVRRVPMGLLFVGPMGTGKTFVAEAFANESGFTALKLKNFRSKWVGSTESNLEKILSIVQAIGQVIVIIDEGDRSFGSQGDSDGGVNSRVIARLKEFMSDTSNRGRILFVLMTNRPDKLDVDIKRAGRLDRKIPFFYSDEPEEVEGVLQAVLRRSKIAASLEFPRDREAVSRRMLNYSNADVEAIALMAAELASAEGAESGATEAPAVGVAHLAKAIDDYLPSRDADMLDYMELQAVFEASSRNLLPLRYKDISHEELQARLEQLKRKLALR